MARTVKQAAARDGRNWWRLVAMTLALGGWVVGIGIVLRDVTNEGTIVGIDLAAYLRAGDDFAAGRPVYVGQIGQLGAFSYAPPWAVLFGMLSWVPDTVMAIAMLSFNLVAIRYVAGSWLWVGLIFWYPVSAMLLYSGNIEFLHPPLPSSCCARGDSGPLAFTGLAKVSPFLGVPRSGWREAALVVGVAVLVTLPWLHLWPEWVEYLLRQPDHHIHPHRAAVVPAPPLRLAASPCAPPMGDRPRGDRGHAITVARHARHHERGESGCGLDDRSGEGPLHAGNCPSEGTPATPTRRMAGRPRRSPDSGCWRLRPE